MPLKDSYPGLPHETLPQRAAHNRQAIIGTAAPCCQRKTVDNEKIPLAQLLVSNAL
jgi:hypothetical protein